MFARFREKPTRLQVSLIETRRVGGKVRHEHIASLGSIGLPFSISGRIAFWQRLHEHLLRLGNRIDVETQAKILSAIHAKVPMVTADEQHSLKLENARADERLWTSLRDMHESSVADHKRLIATAETAVAHNQAAADAAAQSAASAKDRVERLTRGEDVPGGFSPPPDFEKILRDAGFTARDIAHLELLASLPEEAIPIIAKAAVKASDRESRAAARQYARTLIEELDRTEDDNTEP
jgi:hypothetical protein